MKKQLLKSALIAVAGVGLLAGSAMADLLNDRNPQVSVQTGSEDSLQTIINQALNGYNTGSADTPIDVANDQSAAAIWAPAEANVSSYMISLITAGISGQLGIYSYADPTKTYEFASFNGGNIESSFTITSDGSLWVDKNKVETNFGKLFGFYWKNGTAIQYTEDSKNVGGSARALAYEVEEGTSLLASGLIRQADGSLVASGMTIEILAEANNDWILAFEDGNDMDFQDAVFYVEDMKAVPEPATMLLFGVGMAGLAGCARRRNQAK